MDITQFLVGLAGVTFIFVVAFILANREDK